MQCHGSRSKLLYVHADHIKQKQKTNLAPLKFGDNSNVWKQVPRRHNTKPFFFVFFTIVSVHSLYIFILVPFVLLQVSATESGPDCLVFLLSACCILAACQVSHKIFLHPFSHDCQSSSILLHQRVCSGISSALNVSAPQDLILPHLSLETHPQPFTEHSLQYLIS